jgi:hypothetical protein
MNADERGLESPKPFATDCHGFPRIGRAEKLVVQVNAE